MKEIEVSDLNQNFFEAIGKEWMLVCAGEAAHYNVMTASWGGVGWLWNRPVAFVFIRPERHTFTISEKSDSMTLSFLGHSQRAREIYQICGSKSGRDMDKVAVCGLHPWEPEIDGKSTGVAFKEAHLTLVCRKLYADDLKKDALVDTSIDGKWYGSSGGYHKMYILEIQRILVDEDALK